MLFCCARNSCGAMKGGRLEQLRGLKDGLLEWSSQSLYNQPEDFVFASERPKGRKLLDLAAVLKKKIQPAFKRIGITGVGWHTFRHTVGTMLAEIGEHQLTIRDYLRHSNLHVTNKYLQATSKTKRLAHDKLVDAFLPCRLVTQTEPSPTGNAKRRIRILEFASCALLSPNIPWSVWIRACKLKVTVQFLRLLSRRWHIVCT
jgi:integrase-like protein